MKTSLFFFFNDTATTEIYTLSLHDALPIYNIDGYNKVMEGIKNLKYTRLVGVVGMPGDRRDKDIISVGTICGKNFDYLDRKSTRLNSSHANISYAVFCLKKKQNVTHVTPID